MTTLGWLMHGSLQHGARFLYLSYVRGVAWKAGDAFCVHCCLAVFNPQWGSMLSMKQRQQMEGAVLNIGAMQSGQIEQQMR
jgi:hypothetical protein